MTKPSKVEKVFKRINGESVRIVAEVFYGAGLARSVGVYVQKKAPGGEHWKTCSSTPAPNWRKMSVDEYLRHGRSEMLQTATNAEILSVIALLEKN